VFALFCHSNATRALIANPTSNAPLEGIPYHFPKLHQGPRNSVGMWLRTHRQTDTHKHRCAWPQYISRRLRLTWNAIINGQTCPLIKLYK